MRQTLRDRYRDSMAIHGFGYALYEPELFERLRPGTLGYFDDDRRWHPVLHLTDAAAVSALGCTPFTPPHLRAPDTRRWDPLSSTGVKERRLTLEAGVDGTGFGLPANVSFATEYSTTTDFGAVLVCEGDVVMEGYDVRGPFEQWVRDNKMALAKVPELRAHGVVCSTLTYSSERVSLTVWQDAKNTVTVGCTAGAQGVANAAAGGTWLRGRSGSSWTEWADEKRVVFFTGVKCKYSWLGRMKTEPEGNWRGGETFTIWDPMRGDAFDGEIEPIGRDLEEIKSALDGSEYENEDEE
jgi:hypothetical protein